MSARCVFLLWSKDDGDEGYDCNAYGTAKRAMRAVIDEAVGHDLIAAGPVNEETYERASVALRDSGRHRFYVMARVR